MDPVEKWKARSHKDQQVCQPQGSFLAKVLSQSKSSHLTDFLNSQLDATLVWVTQLMEVPSSQPQVVASEDYTVQTLV